MTISRRDAHDFFDHYGFIDLQEKKYIPSMKLCKLMRWPCDLTEADCSRMITDTQRYIHPPVRNPAYVHFEAALQIGIDYNTMIRLGFRDCDSHQAFFSPAEGEYFRKHGMPHEMSSALHALYDYLGEIGKSEAHSCYWSKVDRKVISDWLAQYNIEVV